MMKPCLSMVMLLGAAALITSCEAPHGPPTSHQPDPGAPGWPGHGAKPGIDAVLESPGGSRIRYQDNHGKYVVTLFPDHRYRWMSVSANETMADTREGKWAWKRSGPGKGELDFGDDTWTLRFTAPDKAEAKTEGDTRTYYFTLERL